MYEVSTMTPASVRKKGVRERTHPSCWHPGGHAGTWWLRSSQSARIAS